LPFLFGCAVLGGAMNGVAGGGGFVVLPALLALGAPPIPANATWTIAQAASGIGAVVGFREELPSVRGLLVRHGIASLVGGFVGALLLLRSSPSLFVHVLPFLMLFAVALFAFGGRMLATIRHRHPGKDSSASLPALLGQFAIAIYGGYFGGG